MTKSEATVSVENSFSLFDITPYFKRLGIVVSVSINKSKFMVVINSFEDFKSYEGKEIGVSAWYRIDQEQINKFADATLDHQWIHVDEKRAANEGPFQSTIAHGYLTLSLIPYLWKQIADVRNIKMEVNYGIESFRFGQAVVVNSEVQLQASVKSITNLRGTVKAVIQSKLVIKGYDKPAYVGDVVFLYHFN